VAEADQEKADFYRLNDEALADARAQAVDEVLKLSLPSIINLPKKISGLGFRIGAAYAHAYERLAHLGQLLPSLFALANMEFCLSATQGALWYRYAIQKGVVADSPEMCLRASAEGYLISEGRAWTFYNKLGETTSNTMLARFERGEELRRAATDQVLLRCMGLYWLHDASLMDGEDRLNLVYEGLDALDLADGLAMWDDAYELGKSDAINDPATLAKLRSVSGKAGAEQRVRKDPRTQAKSFVRSCWDDWQQHPARYMSTAQFAQDMLEKQPVLRNAAVIATWCRDWKKGALSPKDYQ
jgi:hypothetical protein